MEFTTIRKCIQNSDVQDTGFEEWTIEELTVLNGAYSHLSQPTLEKIGPLKAQETLWVLGNEMTRRGRLMCGLEPNWDHSIQRIYVGLIAPGTIGE